MELPKVALRPILHMAGENDPLVKFDWQERTIETIRAVNHCTAGKPWDDHAQCTIYPSPDGAPRHHLHPPKPPRPPAGCPRRHHQVLQGVPRQHDATNATLVREPVRRSDRTADM